ncbi:hypothetical protein [Azospirillum rugosum]|uniref:Uncharacterized protein n=1 Tax=Azospirillum rugosum TaxID=416170 RepID=A0ABS4SCU9_9PROT|nr:hypothetical protein [Azospirillum rugosum]MBP2290384.1 hypothetical protein [Azospirillum rugosum]MDQ0527860.1 hypothetical protein [Azospirillum rugosum]
MPDGRSVPAPSPSDCPLDFDHQTFVAMLEEGLASLASEGAVSPDELDRMIDAAFDEQDAQAAKTRL